MSNEMKLKKAFVVRLEKSAIGTTQGQREALRCLGLKKRGSSRTVSDSPGMRGQIMKVQHLVSVSVKEAKQ